MTTENETPYWNKMNYSQDIIDRFWSKVNVKYLDDGTPDFEACMEWNAYTDRSGYGVFSLYRKNIQAHRFSYMCFNGPIPNKLLVCHSCDIPSCINPKHFWLGTIRENTQDMVNKDRQAKGDKIGISKLSEEDVKQIINICISSSIIIQSQIGELFNVTSLPISYIIRGKSWVHITKPILEQYNLTYNDLIFKITNNTGLQAKLNDNKVRQIKILLRDTNFSFSKIANQFGVSKGTISNISHKRAWKHVQI